MIAQTPTRWQPATVVGITDETRRAKTFRLRLHEATPHVAGQHYVIRLIAPDGYVASRSYSIASAPDGSPEFDVTVERLDDGEVSSFLHDVVEPGDEGLGPDPDDLYYATELPGPETTVVYTRRNPPGVARLPGRLTVADLPVGPGGEVTAYICGSTGFADHATDLVIDSGVPAGHIRVERFGPTG